MLDVRHLERALWRSRRGMLELDLLLVDFARRGYPRLSEADKAAYQNLLAEDDWRLWDWLQGQAPPLVAFARIVDLIRAFNQDGANQDGANQEDNNP